ncbi:MAG: DNA polymerase IV [Deltaproteobacteria bacterium]|nr:DNA polymerase IV [Deltaproteobacteria bacterium]
MSHRRIILHADMDAFYAAVEQRDNPELRGRPLVVGGGSARGVVSTASYEARKYGLHSAMPMVEALRKCQDVIVVPPDFTRYKEASAQIMEVFGNYSPLVEPLSLDEAFIDMSGAESLFGAPEEMARSIKRDVFEATRGLTVSVGAATIKYVAKVASDFQKPDGLTVVAPGDELDFLWPQSVSRLWGVGPKSRVKVEEMGLRTIGDVAKAPKKMLEKRLGSLGEHIWNLANGLDDREVVPDHDIKSVSNERTLEKDVRGKRDIRPVLRRLGEQVARRLRKKQLKAGGVRVKLKTSSFRLLTRQAPIQPPSDSAKELLSVADNLLDQFNLGEPMRLVGIAGFDLVEDDVPVQQELFVNESQERNRKLDRTLDSIIDRFGDDILKRGD